MYTLQCICVCIAGHTAGQLMCVGGRSGSSFLQERRMGSGTATADCPSTSESFTANAGVRVRGLFVWSRRQGKPSLFQGRGGKHYGCSSDAQ